VGEQHVAHLRRVHASRAQVAQHLAQAGTEALRGAGVDQGEVVALADQESVDRGLQAFAVFGYIAAIEQAGDQGGRDTHHFLPAQRDHAIEQGGDLQGADALVVDAQHLLGGGRRGGFGHGSQRQGGQCQQQRGAQGQVMEVHEGLGKAGDSVAVQRAGWRARDALKPLRGMLRGLCTAGLAALHLLQINVNFKSWHSVGWRGGSG